MATTSSFAAPMNHSKYYLNPPTGPSPPETTSLGGKNPHQMAASQSQSPTSSHAVSPTNYHANVRQLRPPRQPLYVPAALRPTDKPARPTDIPGRPRAPDTPPTSNDSSFGSGKLDSPVGADFAAFPFVSGASSDVESLRRALSRAASETLSLEEVGAVTGPPTTAHWKPDESSSVCFVCKESFTWYFRRHHCRRCGNLVCDYHVKSLIPLDQNARIHPQGLPSKSCDTCFDDWKLIQKLHHSRANSVTESSHSSQGTAMPIPSQPRPSEDMRVGSMARSEGGYAWSTF